MPHDDIPNDAQASWQPLETAPLDPLRDPPLVMLWVDDGGQQGKGTHAFGRCYRSHDGKVRGVASGFSGNWSIRYWQPLPAGPSMSSTQNAGPMVPWELNCKRSVCAAPECDCPAVTSTDREAIPAGIYFSAEHDNFYSAVGSRGCGNAFYSQWKSRRGEFPQDASSVTSTDGATR